MRLDPGKKELRVIKRNSHVKGKDVLEIGCGSGRLSFPASKGAKSYTGIDTDRKAIAEAARRANGINNLAFRYGTGNRLSFDDRSFDIVFLFMTLHEIPLPKQSKTLSEIHRVLRPNGKLILVEPLPYGEVQSLYDIFNSALRHMNHPKAVLHARKAISDAVRKKMFRRMKRVRYDIDWHFSDVGELFRLFCKEYSVPRNDHRINRFLKHAKLLIPGKFDKKPLIVFDEMQLSILKKI
jgi:ubiquinone/menaquinone biosynthesis C-methylase UbiE